MNLEDLKTILEATKTVDGRASIRITGHLELLCEIAKSQQYSSGSYAVALVRCLRNAIAGDIENASMLWENEIILWTATLSREIAMSKGNFDGDDGSKNKVVLGLDLQSRAQFVTSMCQLLSNFAACGVQFSDLLWSDAFGGDRFRDLIAAAQTVGSRPAVAAVISAIYNTLQAGLRGSQNGDRSTIAKFCISKGLLCQVLLSALPPLNSIGSTNHGPLEGVAKNGDLGDKSDPVLEWMHLLVFALVRTGHYLTEAFNTVRPREEGENVWDTSNNGSNSSTSHGSRNESSSRETKPAVPLRLTHEQSILLEFVRDVLEDPGCTVDIEASPLYAIQAVSDSDPRPTIDHLNFFVALAQLLPLPSCDQPHLQSQASGVCSTGKSHKEEKIVIPGVTDGVNLLETHAAALSLLTVLSAGLACASRTVCVPLRSVLATGSPLVAFCLSCLDARRRLVEARRLQQMHRRKAKAGSHGTVDNRRPSSASRSTLSTSIGPTTVSTAAYSTASPSPTPSTSTAAAVLTLDADDKADGKGKSVPKAAPSTQNSSGKNTGSSSITSHEELPSEGDRTQTITTEGETQAHEGKVDDDDEEAEDDDDEVDEDEGAVRAEETAVSAAALNVSPEVAEVTKDLTKLALQVLGNLMYGCKAAQDELRERSGLPLVLSHCGTDFENPLAREWALLCIRNACEGNEDNQRYIDSLKPQSVIKDDATLSRHGLSMEIDPQSGKFKLHQSLGHLPKGASSTVDSNGTNTDTGKVEGGQGEAPPLNDFRNLASGALAGRNIPHRDDRENGVFADN